MGYDHYKDQNGITWTVVWQDGRHTAIATVLDDAQPRYEPDLGDVRARMDPGGVAFFGTQIIKGDLATDEQQRVLFIELTQKIEALAAQHGQRGTALRVSTSAPMSPLVVLGLLVAAAWILDELDG